MFSHVLLPVCTVCFFRAFFIHSFYCVFISKTNDFEFNTKKYNILSWMKIIQLDYSLTTVILWPFGPRNSPLSQENLTNLTEQDEEPKVPVVIIERLRLPGGFGGAQNIPTRWSDISKFDLEGDFCVLMERRARKCKISELDGELFLNVWYLVLGIYLFLLRCLQPSLLLLLLLLPFLLLFAFVGFCFGCLLHAFQSCWFCCFPSFFAFAALASFGALGV